MEEIGVIGENQRPAKSHWQTLSHNVVSRTPHHKLTTLVMIGTDCIGSCKSNRGLEVFWAKMLVINYAGLKVSEGGKWVQNA